MALVPYTKKANKNDTAAKMMAPVANRLNSKPQTVSQARVGPMVPKYSSPDQMTECAARLLKARMNPWGDFKAAPCNVSSTAANTIRFRTFLRVSGQVGSNGWGFVAINSVAAAVYDLRAVSVSDAAYTGAGFNTTAPGVSNYATQGSFFASSDVTGSGDTVKIRRVAGGIKVTPTSPPITSQGYFQPWQAQGSGFSQTMAEPQLAQDAIAPVVGYSNDKKYVAVWTPSSSEEENWIDPAVFSAGGVDSNGADIALLWIRGAPSSPFLVEFTFHYEAESFVRYASMALPSEHDPAGAAAISTASARIVRNNLAVPVSSNDGFFHKAWNWIKDEGSSLLKTTLPDIASAAGKALLSLL